MAGAVQALKNDIKELTELFKGAGSAGRTPPVSEDGARKNANAGRFRSHGGVESGALQGGDTSPVNPVPMPAHLKGLAKGHVWGRFLRAKAAAVRINNDSSEDGYLKIVNDVWRDREMVKWVEGFRTKDVLSTVPSQGGFLVQSPISTDFIEFLRDFLWMSELGCTEIGMPYGNLTINRQTGTIVGQYVGEGPEASPITETPTFGHLKLVAKKAMALVRVSNDMLEIPDTQADTIVAEDAREALGVLMETKAIYGLGKYSPLGLLTPYPGLTSVTTGGTVTANTPVLFLKALLDAKVKINKAMKVGWLMEPTIWEAFMNLAFETGQFVYRDEMQQKGTLMGKPFCVTQILQESGGAYPILFGDWRQLYLARQCPPKITWDPGATVPDENGVMQSATAQDETVLSIIDKHDIQPRQQKAIAVAVDATP